MFAVHGDNIRFASGHLPTLLYPIQEAWKFNEEWLAIVFSANRVPVSGDDVGLFHYERVPHANQASYRYCLMGGTVLVVPNPKGRTRVCKEIGRIIFPWNSTLILSPDPGSSQDVPPAIGSRTLQVEVCTA